MSASDSDHSSTSEESGRDEDVGEDEVQVVTAKKSSETQSINETTSESSENVYSFRPFLANKDHLSKPPGKATSLIWQFFHAFTDGLQINISEGLDGKACCNICGAVVTRGDGTTTNMKRHMSRKHRDVYADFMAKEEQKQQRGKRNSDFANQRL